MIESPLVLVVDDYEDTQELYREFLTQAGFRVAGATTGEEAVDKALTLVPDVILMDLSLPGMDGREATRRIRHDSRMSGVRIIALTGHSARDVQTAEYDLFLTKPCVPAKLVAEIRRLCGPKAL